MSSNYKFIDHTADIAVEVTANTIDKLFITSGLAFREIIIESGTSGNNESFMLELNSHSLETLLVNFLNELNFRVNHKGRILKDITAIKILQNNDNWSLSCDMLEENIDPDKIKTEIKSVTYHQMNLNKTEEGYKTIIVFDI